MLTSFVFSWKIPSEEICLKLMAELRQPTLIVFAISGPGGPKRITAPS